MFTWVLSSFVRDTWTLGGHIPTASVKIMSSELSENMSSFSGHMGEIVGRFSNVGRTSVDP